MRIGTKRIYEPASDDDGVRILVDRLWPRGLKKADVHIDLWVKEVAPSAELRGWFGHDPSRWEEFKRRYKAELRENVAEVEALQKRIGSKAATLLYAAKDEKHNNAVVLRDFLQSFAE